MISLRRKKYLIAEKYQGINMKQYKITKLLYADSIKDAILRENQADIVEVGLNEDYKPNNITIGFNEERFKMVPKINKRLPKD